MNLPELPFDNHSIVNGVNGFSFKLSDLWGGKKKKKAPPTKEELKLEAEKNRNKSTMMMLGGIGAVTLVLGLGILFSKKS